MDRSAAYHRLTGAGLEPEKATALTDLLWNVHEAGEIREVDLAHLSDSGFSHVDVCIMCELLLAALSRRVGPAAADTPVLTILEAFGRRDAGTT